MGGFYMKKEINQYLEWKASYTTRAAKVYKPHLLRFQQITQIDDVSKITRQDVVRFQAQIAKKYSESHVALALVVIKNFLCYLHDEGISSLKPHTIKIPRFSTKAYAHITFEEFQKMEKVVTTGKFSDLRIQVALHLLWYGGLRVSELCDMDLTMIDDKVQGAFIVTKKSGKKDWVFWPHETHQLLVYYLNLRLSHSQKPPLILSRNDKRISTKSVQRWINIVAQKANIPKKVVPHSFRHGRAHRILELGGNVKDVQWWLRHSERNPQASFQYLRLNPTERYKRAQNLF